MLNLIIAILLVIIARPYIHDDTYYLMFSFLAGAIAGVINALQNMRSDNE